MGAAISSNTVQSMIQDSINVINNYSQTCAISATGAQNLINVGTCTIKDSKIFIDNKQILNQSCLQNDSSQVTISSAVLQSMRQAASSATSFFDFGNVTDANNFIQASIDLADAISTTFNSTCVAQISGGNNEIVCQGGTITNSVIGINDYQSLTQSCILTSTNVINAATNVVSKLQQSAVAKNESIFSIIAIVFVSILAIGSWFIINVATDPFYQWLVVGIILMITLSSVIYTITAKNAGNYPFKKA